MRAIIAVYFEFSKLFLLNIQSGLLFYEAKMLFFLVSKLITF